MSYRMMFTINAVILAIFGVVFMINPQFVLDQFGATEQYVQTTFVARLMGSAMLLSSLFLWIVKDSAPVKMQKNIAFLLLAYSIGGFVVSVLGMTSIGILRVNAWVLLVLFGLFSMLYGYILFLQPKHVEAKPRSPRKAKDVPPVNSGQTS